MKETSVAHPELDAKADAPGRHGFAGLLGELDARARVPRTAASPKPPSAGNSDSASQAVSDPFGWVMQVMMAKPRT